MDERPSHPVDWAATPLGPCEAWPSALAAAVPLCLDAGFPMRVYAGDDLVMVYGDALSPGTSLCRHTLAPDGSPGGVVPAVSARARRHALIGFNRHR